MPAKKKESKLWFHSKSEISHIIKCVPPVNHNSKMYTVHPECLSAGGLIQTASLRQVSSLNAEFTRDKSALKQQLLLLSHFSRVQLSATP